MAEQNPAYVITSEDHTAEQFRRMLATVTNDDEGVHGDGLEVTEKSGTPNMSVDVATGRAFVAGDTGAYQGTYFCDNQGTTNVVLDAADGSNPRYDIIVAQVQDDEYNVEGVNAWSLDKVTGTPAGSPAVPSTPDTALKLAEVYVDTSVGSVTDSDITDTRPFIDDWTVVTSSVWTNVTLGTGGVEWLAYKIRGKEVTFQAGFQLGTGGSLSGVLSMAAPSSLEIVTGDVLLQHVSGVALDANLGTRWRVDGFANVSTDWVTRAVGADNTLGITTGSPFTWTTSDVLAVSGTLLLA